MWDAELLYRELPATRGAGIPEVWVSAKGRATEFPSHPLSYDKGEFPAGAVNRAVSSQGRRLGWPASPTDSATMRQARWSSSAMASKYTGWGTALLRRAGENEVKRTAGSQG